MRRRRKSPNPHRGNQRHQFFTRHAKVWRLKLQGRQPGLGGADGVRMITEYCRASPVSARMGSSGWIRLPNLQGWVAGCVSGRADLPRTFIARHGRPCSARWGTVAKRSHSDFRVLPARRRSNPRRSTPRPLPLACRPFPIPYDLALCSRCRRSRLYPCGRSHWLFR